MLAVFGMPGHLELVILVLAGMVVVGVPIMIIFVVVFVSRMQKGSTPAAMPCPKCGMLAPEHGYCPHCGNLDVA